MTTTEAARLDLSKFSANETDPREYLRQPWRRGAWVYATNGHVCVRVLVMPMRPEIGMM